MSALSPDQIRAMEAVGEVDEGSTVASVARRYGVTPATVRAWQGWRDDWDRMHRDGVVF